MNENELAIDNGAYDTPYRHGLRIHGVVSIFDNGEFVTLVTDTGSAVHLPDGEHSISIKTKEVEGHAWGIDYVAVDLHV